MSWKVSKKEISTCYCDYCKAEGYDEGQGTTFAGWWYIRFGGGNYDFNHLCPSCASILTKVRKDLNNWDDSILR